MFKRHTHTHICINTKHPRIRHKKIVENAHCIQFCAFQAFNLFRLVFNRSKWIFMLRWIFQCSNGNSMKTTWEGKSRNWKGKLRRRRDDEPRRPGNNYLASPARRDTQKFVCTFGAMLGWPRKGGSKKRRNVDVVWRRKTRDVLPKSRNRRGSRRKEKSRKRDGNPSELGMPNWLKSKSNIFQKTFEKIYIFIRLS